MEQDTRSYDLMLRSCLQSHSRPDIAAAATRQNDTVLLDWRT